MIVHFIGGVHGAGKSTLCSRLKGALGAHSARASELLRFQPSTGDSTGKAVKDVEANQDRLIAALRTLELSTSRLLLDGHFCVLGSTHDAVEIPLQTYTSIRPVSLTLLRADSEVVQKRLAERDGRSVATAVVHSLAECEQRHAYAVASHLGVPLQVVSSATPDESILAFLRKAEDRLGAA